ncbi:MAG: histidinol dehydrogenase [Cytophagales bacterium]|jgi:histidinol dehydrogenase|nr:histidinol dehydrogenase [Cytophagales bacterium]MCA6387889.1 histidinol dehydrogenase [Cytophagales bacterium]MCA6390969.1 histidinol dehydrogenase [Cytophagales bacterium]MCA6394900.1 histidinol dehydrogenase [Cytophagales bacterium]MCA6398356.1 histidinol dehydrogenase [Cytophagales bacterium]
MRLEINPPKNKWAALCQRPQMELEYLDSSVKNTLARVKKSGDEALKELTKQFDQVHLNQLQVTDEEVKKAIEEVSESLKNAIHAAASNITKFHAAQKKDDLKVETQPGVTCWRKGVAIQKAGIYIPGGSAPLFSTVLMLAIPAKLAGCEEVILCTPPDKEGKINSAILFAASITGVKKIFKVGGAQAIAAMAYGTATIPAVNKIFGPGNQFVTKAKQLINQEGTAIDMPAGPSEVLVIADESTNPSFIAADLLSQAEHGADSQVVLVTLNKAIVEATQKELTQQLSKLPRVEVAQQALKNSLAIVFNSSDALVDYVNAYAPEHLIINTTDCDSIAEKIINAGSIFLGPYSPESVGDYASGTNHTLPTNGCAKAYSGVSLDSFMKYITIQKLTKEGLNALGPVVEEMAEAEQLRGHAEAIRIRRK